MSTRRQGRRGRPAADDGPVLVYGRNPVRELIRARGRLDDLQVAGIGSEIAAALASAHAAGVVPVMF